METTQIGSGKNFKIGPITVEPGRNILSQGSDIFALEPKIMDVLEYLATHQGKVCSRDDIIASVWNVEYGADESLTRAISVIRKTLRQAGGQGRYIQTIPKRGYSLQEVVAIVDDPIRPATPSPQPPAMKTRPAPAIENTPLPSEVDPANLSPERGDTLPPRKKTSFGLLGLACLAVIGASITFMAWDRFQTPEAFGSELAVSPYGRSVAVMPFVDLSVDKAHQYFSDGVAEELSNELRKIDDLRIVGQRLGGTVDYSNMSYEEVGDKLKVSHIIHGSVRTQGERVRITTQLINTEDNSHAWSSVYDGTLDDVFDLQQRVSADVVLELSLVLSLNISEPIELDEFLPLSFAPETQ